MQEPLSIRAAFKSKIPLLTARVRKRKRATPGSSPGVIVPTADAIQPRIKIYSYDKDSLEEKEVTSVEEIKKQLAEKSQFKHWIEIKGFGDAAMLENLATAFSIHRLEMEDVVNT